MVIKRTSTNSASSTKTTGSTRSGAGDLQSMIAKKAYELYAKRGYSHGSDKSDWNEAEKWVRANLR